MAVPLAWIGRAASSFMASAISSGRPPIGRPTDALGAWATRFGTEPVLRITTLTGGSLPSSIIVETTVRRPASSLTHPELVLNAGWPMIDGTVTFARFIFTSLGICATLFARRSARWRCKRAISEPHVILVCLFFITSPSKFLSSVNFTQSPPRVAGKQQTLHFEDSHPSQRKL